MQETYCMHTLSTSTVTAAASAAPAATPAAMQQYETAVQTVKERSSKDSICVPSASALLRDTFFFPQYETVVKIVRSSKDSICSTKRVRVAARQLLLPTPSPFLHCPICAAIIITRSARILKRRDFACVTCLAARLKLLYAC